MATPKSILSHPTLLALVIVIVIELASQVFAMGGLSYGISRSRTKP